MKPLLTSLALIFLGALIATIWLERRANWLSSIEYRISYPDIPVEITSTIKNAEREYYATRSFVRRGIEATQDIITFAAPAATYAFDFSVGPYRLKAKTIEEILPWAEDNGYLEIIQTPKHHALQSIAYFAEQPAIANWGAAILLEYLRQEHPLLSERNWQEISKNPNLVAKLYSGYMGAGGDWDLWKADLEPGPEAKRRLGLN